ncbi:uncharacterized protein LOC141723935 [Apium graveolens]|uniref:uncharacterized protein LOC141723935 n=1 Tax=Apium graveolens TaxID=4045 RepID=UPI003D7AF9DD
MRSLEEDLVMRIAKRPKSSRVRQGQNSSRSDVIAAIQAACAQLFGTNTNKWESFVVEDEIKVLCQDDGMLCQGSDMRSCWFRRRIVNISLNCLKGRGSDSLNGLQTSNRGLNLQSLKRIGQVRAQVVLAYGKEEQMSMILMLHSVWNYRSR